MELHNITYRAIGNRIELTLSSNLEEVPAEIVGTLLSVEHSITSPRGRRLIATDLVVAVGGNRISVSHENVTEIATYDQSGTKLEV